MEMTSLEDSLKKKKGELVGLYLRSPWYFETFVDKLVLLTFVGLGVWKIIGWIW